MPDNFEKQVRGRLEDHPSEVDALAIWEAVEGRLEKKKRRGIIWWLPGLLLVIGAAIWWNSSLSDKKILSETITAFPLPMESVVACNAKDEEQIQVASDDHGKSLASQVQEGGYQSSSVFSEADANEPPTFTETSVLGKADAEKPTTFTEAPAAKSQASQLTNTPIETVRAAPRIELTISPSEAASAMAAKQVLASSFAYVPTLKLAYLNLPESELLDRKEKLRLNRLAQKNAEEIFQQSKGPYWSLAIEEAVNAPLATLTVDLPEGSVQAERNEATITNLESFSSSLLLGFHLGNRWSLRSGLTYRRINSRTDYQTSTSEEFIDPEGIISIRVDAAGDSTFVTGPVPSVRTTTGRFRYYNSKTTFDLPLLLGYQFGKKKLRFALEAGPVINLASISKSTLLGTGDQFFSASNDNGWFRNRLSGLGWVASGKVLYPITPKTQISFGLRYERTPGSGFERKSVGYRTRYDLLGVNLGVIKKF